MSKYEEVLQKHPLRVTQQAIEKELARIKETTLGEVNSTNLQKLLSCIDLTSLNNTDNATSIQELTNKVNDFSKHFPTLPNVAAICVFPNLVQIVKSNLTDRSVKIATVAGGFPSAQTFTEIKIAEVALAKLEGAQEIDILFPISLFLNKQLEEASEEIQEMKATAKEATLKVILETGTLKSPHLIYQAAMLSIYSGADFIKTSTGKTETGATSESAYIICLAIREYHKKTGIKIGFKVSGGIKTVPEAIYYYSIVKEILGEEWLSKELFRLGTSALTNLIISEIEKKEVHYY